MSKETELAWAAGFFDGEGCTHLTTEGYAGMSIAQCDPEVIERFHRAVGKLGILNGPYAGRRKGWRQQWWWRAMGHDVTGVMEKLRPYLGTVKKKQFAAVMAEARVPHRKGFCRQDLHKMTKANTASSGRCLACRRTSNNAYWTRKTA